MARTIILGRWRQQGLTEELSPAMNGRSVSMRQVTGSLSFQSKPELHAMRPTAERRVEWVVFVGYTFQERLCVPVQLGLPILIALQVGNRLASRLSDRQAILQSGGCAEPDPKGRTVLDCCRVNIPILSCQLSPSRGASAVKTELLQSCRSLMLLVHSCGTL